MLRSTALIASVAAVCAADSRPKSQVKSRQEQGGQHGQKWASNDYDYYDWTGKQKNAKSAKGRQENDHEHKEGGHNDKHGCCISCGYQWCASLKKCYREWEEKADFCPGAKTKSAKGRQEQGGKHGPEWTSADYDYYDWAGKSKKGSKARKAGVQRQQRREGGTNGGIKYDHFNHGGIDYDYYDWAAKGDNPEARKRMTKGKMQRQQRREGGTNGGIKYDHFNHGGIDYDYYDWAAKGDNPEARKNMKKGKMQRQQRREGGTNGGIKYDHFNHGGIDYDYYDWAAKGDNPEARKKARRGKARQEEDDTSVRYDHFNHGNVDYDYYDWSASGQHAPQMRKRRAAKERNAQRGAGFHSVQSLRAERMLKAERDSRTVTGHWSMVYPVAVLAAVAAAVGLVLHQKRLASPQTAYGAIPNQKPATPLVTV